MPDNARRKAAKAVLIRELHRFPTAGEVSDYLASHRNPATTGGTHGGPTGGTLVPPTGGPTGAPSRATNLREVKPVVKGPSGRTAQDQPRELSPSTPPTLAVQKKKVRRNIGNALVPSWVEVEV